MGFLTIAARRSGSVAERCAVAAGEKLPCGGSSFITQADCEANNCCYDLSSSTSPCYYGNDVTVQCTLDGQFVVVVSEKVTLPPLDLGSLQLVDSSSIGCSPVTSLSSFVVYQFPVSACGSTVQLAGGNVTYQNTMSAAIAVRSGPEGSITRDSVYKLFFQCTYSGSQDVQVEAEVYTVAPPLPVVEQGPFDLELVIATDSSYGSYYVDADYPVTKTLRDPVALEVHIVNRTDPNLVLTLGDCWVTPGPSASSQPQWSLLVNGCPYTGDNYLTSLVTVDSTSGVAYPSHYKRFVFEMFAFVDPVARQALAEKVGFVAMGNSVLLEMCRGLQFGVVCIHSNGKEYLWWFLAPCNLVSFSLCRSSSTVLLLPAIPLPQTPVLRAALQEVSCKWQLGLVVVSVCRTWHCFQIQCLVVEMCTVLWRLLDPMNMGWDILLAAL
ncbi:ZP4 protein, partial [Polypterus senegalus]